MPPKPQDDAPSEDLEVEVEQVVIEDLEDDDDDNAQRNHALEVPHFLTCALSVLFVPCIQRLLSGALAFIGC